MFLITRDRPRNQSRPSPGRSVEGLTCKTPIAGTGDYADAFVVDADGRLIPWTDVSHIDQDEMSELMQEIFNRLYQAAERVRYSPRHRQIGPIFALSRRAGACARPSRVLSGRRLTYRPHQAILTVVAGRMGMLDEGGLLEECRIK